MTKIKRRFLGTPSPVIGYVLAAVLQKTSSQWLPLKSPPLQPKPVLRFMRSVPVARNTALEPTLEFICRRKGGNRADAYRNKKPDNLFLSSC